MKRSKRRTVPVQDLGINDIPTPEEVMKYFHLRHRYIIEDDNPVDFAYPSLIDPPMHGKVKKYTKKEIKEYNDVN